MAQAATKANGVIDVSVTEEGVVSAVYTATEGLVGQLTDALTTLLSTQKVCVGNAALMQRIALPLAGNILAVHSYEQGKFGIAGFGKNFVMGR